MLKKKRKLKELKKKFVKAEVRMEWKIIKMKRKEERRKKKEERKTSGAKAPDASYLIS